jgi:hypothetical protein
VPTCSIANADDIRETAISVFQVLFLLADSLVMPIAMSGISARPAGSTQVSLYDDPRGRKRFAAGISPLRHLVRRKDLFAFGGEADIAWTLWIGCFSQSDRLL